MPRGVEPKGDARNENKFQRYKLDWGKRISRAIGTKNYTQAIIAEAAIIEDRLLSFLFKAGAFPKDASPESIKKTRLTDLLKLWKQNATEPLDDRFLGNLHEATKKWFERRNRIAHGGAGSVKSLPGESHADPEEFDEFERTTAVEGVRLVKSVQNWYSREKGRRKREGNPLD